jgi:hypothetical protein
MHYCRGAWEQYVTVSKSQLSSDVNLFLGHFHLASSYILQQQNNQDKTKFSNSKSNNRQKSVPEIGLSIAGTNYSHCTASIVRMGLAVNNGEHCVKLRLLKERQK